MKLGDIGEKLWEAVYLILLAVILSYCWISFRMEVLSPISVRLPFFVLIAGICGALVYLFVGKVYSAFYACTVMCVIACMATAVYFLMPTFQGLLDPSIGPRMALDAVVMAIFTIPFSFGGNFVAAYLSPD